MNQDTNEETSRDSLTHLSLSILTSLIRWKHEAVLARSFLSPSSSTDLKLSLERVIFNFGASHSSLLRVGENRSQTLIGLENFLQRVQLLSTGLLLSEAMAGAPTSDADDTLSESLSSRSLPFSSTPNASSSPVLEHQNLEISSALKECGAIELLKRFELHPSPHQKMKALLVLERLVIAQLSMKKLPSLPKSAKEDFRYPPVSTPRARSPATSTTVENLSRSNTATNTNSQRKNSARPPSPLVIRRPVFNRADSDQSRKTNSTKGGADSFRPMSLRVSNNKGRRALSMYEDLDEEETGSTSGLPGFSGLNGPSIHEMLASLTSPGSSSTSNPNVASSSQTQSTLGDIQPTSPTSDQVSPSMNSSSTEKLSIKTQDLDLDQSSDSVSLGSASNRDEREEEFKIESSQDSLIMEVTTSPISHKEKEKEIEPPNTDQVVNALESILLDSDCRPQDLLVNLQLICAFSPTSVLDIKDEVSKSSVVLIGFLRDPFSISFID